MVSPEIVWDQRVSLTDGVEISMDLYGISTSERRPVILFRTPYGKSTDQIVSVGKFFASRGYVFAAADVRGRGDSDGHFTPYRGEGRDGYDLLEWLSKQKWSSGRTATWGASYSGRIQWYTALLRPPSLKAMISVVTPSDPFVEDPTGCPSPLNLSWDFLVSGRSLQNTRAVNWQEIYGKLPLDSLDSLTGRKIPHWHDRIEHQTMDDYNDSISYQKRIDMVNVPVMHISGWYDDEQIGTPLNFSRMVRNPDRKVASNQYLLMGPWGHSVNSTRVLGEFDFGPEAIIDLLELESSWLDVFLKNSNASIPLKKRTRIFIMGLNRWYDYEYWPPENSRESSIFLQSGGRANSRFGDGKLTFDPPEYEEMFDSFTYDPGNPVPFISEQNYAQIGGPDDYSSIERRDDVLVYSSEPLKDRFTIAGPVWMNLHASTSAGDTDFTAKLLTVLPDMRAVRLCDGVVRMRYRNGFMEQERTVPGEIYEIRIDMWNTAYSFSRGERIRVEISSSAFPKYARNLNIPGDQTGLSNWEKAEQKVFHGKSKPSFLRVNVLEAI